MRSFLQGWRRKMGVVTLVLACLLMGGWLRSRSNTDCIEIPVSQHSMVSIGATKHVLGMAYHTSDDPNESSFDFWSNPEIGNIDDVLSINGILPLQSGSTDFRWRILCAGFAIGRSDYLTDFQSRFSFVVVPYWSVVIPLTLLSACLLMWKPGSSTCRKNTKPSSEKTDIMAGGLFNCSRRNLGLLMLVFACAFDWAWVKSLWHKDRLVEVNRKQGERDHVYQLDSLLGETVWTHVRNLDPENPFTQYFGRLSVGGNETYYLDFVYGIPVEWRIQFGGFAYGDGEEADQSNSCSITIVPYWAFVVPLSLLSAWLMLWPSRSSTLKKTAEPIPQTSL